MKCPYCKTPMTKVSIRVDEKNRVSAEHFECPVCDAKLDATYDFSKLPSEGKTRE